jgi:hypothetical protein
MIVVQGLCGRNAFNGKQSTSTAFFSGEGFFSFRQGWLTLGWDC